MWTSACFVQFRSIWKPGKKETFHQLRSEKGTNQTWETSAGDFNAVKIVNAKCWAPEFSESEEITSQFHLLDDTCEHDMILGHE